MNSQRNGLSQYNKIYEYPFTLHNQNVQMIMTSVSGHLLSTEFPLTYKSWKSCNPVELFTAEVIQYCKEDYMPIKKTLEREVKNCKKLIIWTDCDREGIWEGFIFNGDVNEIKTSHVLKKVKESGWKS